MEQVYAEIERIAREQKGVKKQEPKRREYRHVPSILERAVPPGRAEEIYEKLNLTSRLLYGTNYLNLRTPFARFAVSIAAFHPGAQRILEKYGPDVFKSKTFMQALLGRAPLTGVTVKPKGKPPIHIPFVDLQRAKVNGAAFSRKAIEKLEVDIPVVEATPGLFATGGFFFIQPQVVFHPYTLQVGNKKARVFLPEEPTTAQKGVAIAGSIAGTLLPAGLVGKLTAGARLGAIARTALMGGAVGAERAITHLAPPAEAARMIGEEAAYWGTFPIVGRALSFAARPLRPLGRAIAEAQPRLATAAAEAVTQGVAEALVGTGITRLETGRWPTAREVAGRVALQAAIGGGMGAMMPMPTANQLARQWERAIEGQRAKLKAQGYTDQAIEPILNTLGLNLRHQGEMVNPELTAQALQRLPAEVRKYFEPTPRVEPTQPTAVPLVEPTEAQPAPTPTAPTTPPTPLSLDEALDVHARLDARVVAEGEFLDGQRLVRKSTVRKGRAEIEKLLGRKLTPVEREQVEDRLEREYQQLLNELWSTRSVREMPNYNAMVRDLAERARREGWKPDKMKTNLKQALADEAFQRVHLRDRGWRRIARRDFDLIEQDVRSLLTQPEAAAVEPPKVPAPEEVPPAPEPTPEIPPTPEPTPVEAPQPRMWEHRFSEGEVVIIKEPYRKDVVGHILGIDGDKAIVKTIGWVSDVREVPISNLMPTRLNADDVVFGRSVGEIGAEIRERLKDQKPKSVGDAVLMLREQYPEVNNLPVDVQIAMGRFLFENWDTLVSTPELRTPPEPQRPEPPQIVTPPPPGEFTVGAIKLPPEPNFERLVNIKRTDQTSVKSAVSANEGVQGEIAAVADNGAWVKVGDLMLQVEPDLLPSPELGYPRGMQKGDAVFFDAPFDPERIRRGELVWEFVPMVDKDGNRVNQWVLTEADNLPAQAMHVLEEPKTETPSRLPYGRSRQRGAVLGPSEWIAGLKRIMQQTGALVEDTVPPGVGYKERNVSMRSLSIARVLMHYGAPSEKAAGLKHPAGLQLYRRVSDEARAIRELEMKWATMADEALNGTTEDERLRMFTALQNDTVYQALQKTEPELARRVDIIKQIIKEVGDEAEKEGLIVKRTGFDISHILWGDWVARVYFKDANGQDQVAVIGAYGSIENARADAIAFARNLQTQGATEIRIEVDGVSKLPAAASRFHALALQRLMGEAEAQARHLQTALETYQNAIQKILQNPGLIDPNSPAYNPQLHAHLQTLEAWLAGTIDDLPADIMNALRAQLQLQPTPWWVGRRRLNLETYDRRLEVVLPAYLQSVVSTLFNRKVRRAYREILAEHTNLTPEEAAQADVPALIRNTTIDPYTLVFMDEYVDTVTGGRNAIGKLNSFLKTVLPNIDRTNAIIATLSAIKYLGLNLSKWVINLTQPFQLTAPLVGFERTFKAWLDVPKLFPKARLKQGAIWEVQGQKYTLDELARITGIDIQDFRHLFGLAEYLDEVWDRAAHILMMPFASAEVPNRLTAALAGIDYGLTMLRPWLSDPQIRQKIINGQPPVELREGIGRYLEGSAQQFWRFFRDKIPKWAAEVESGARSLDEVLHEASLEVGRWVVDKTQFRQDVTDMPMFISRGGTLGRLWFQFGNFLVHQLEFLFGPGTTIEQKAKAFAVMMALGGLAGLPLFEEIDYLIRKISNERLSPKTALLVRAADETSPEHWWALGLYKGLPSFLGVDMSQSVGLPLWQLYQRIAAQPDIETNLVAFLARRAPGGAMLVDAFMAALDYARSPSDRSFRRLIYALMPVGIARALQAYYANAEGVLRSPVKGRALLKDVDKTVIAALAMGFTPTKSALVSEIRKELVRAGEKAQAERSAIAEQIADLYAKGTKRILTDEERERFHELLMRFYELDGDWRAVKERIEKLLVPEAAQLWKGQVSEKDILRSPTMKQLAEVMRSLVGE